MKCKVCGTEFEGNNCPACATPLKESKYKSAHCFYKDPWFWVSVFLLFCLVFNPLKDFISVNKISKNSSADFNDTVSEFFADTTSSAPQSSSMPQISSDYYSITTSETSTSKANSSEEKQASSSKINITDSTAVYVTPSGKRYHISAACAGKNKIATTVAKAAAADKTPCKKCSK